MTGPGDLGGLLHLVARLVAGRPVSTQSDHASCETGQVTHLMLQKTPFPLRYVGQPTARLPHQVGFYCLNDKEQQRVLGACQVWFSLLNPTSDDADMSPASA